MRPVRDGQAGRLRLCIAPPADAVPLPVPRVAAVGNRLRAGEAAACARTSSRAPTAGHPSGRPGSGTAMRPAHRSTGRKRNRVGKHENGGDNGDNRGRSAGNTHGYWVPADRRVSQVNGDTAGTERGQRGQEIERRERFLFLPSSSLNLAGPSCAALNWPQVARGLDHLRHGLSSGHWRTRCPRWRRCATMRDAMTGNRPPLCRRRSMPAACH
jgi:hypothetical protein